ncbi:hypothetical protein D9758_000854 [Tetrapyrgos nigripes]|uniref:Uncharacterized protein n=1 Tax=Tetrapyrgos nigripes TaxID=182062 RepID=A0A8H5LY82_9AGAR|nr:hypothetical protein D9758_000854 [Tetrapyrgos nigripes]
MCSYDFFKQTLLNKTIPVLDYQLRDSLPLHALASCMAGTFATTVCSPADVIRSRIMSSVCSSSLDISTVLIDFSLSIDKPDSMNSERIQSCAQTPLQILRTSLQTEGIGFLFKGWTPAFFRLGPNTVLLFIFFEVATEERMEVVTFFIDLDLDVDMDIHIHIDAIWI